MSTLKEGHLLLKNGRLRYPKLFTPAPIKGDPSAKPRYSCVFYLPKSDTKTKEMIDAEIERLSKLHLNGKIPKASNLFIRDGDGEDGDSITAGCWIISANRSESQKRPQVVDKDGRTPIDSQDTKLYAGCRVNILVDIYKPSGWDRICCGLEIVQWIGDDEPLGAGGVKAEDVMPNLEDEDEDEI